ncbi:MAG: hypothetical protein PHT40_00070 [Patescibacteria group bacterium]|nr:hypothetical protein [Patescibacteria group bacterium]
MSASLTIIEVKLSSDPINENEDKIFIKNDDFIEKIFSANKDGLGVSGVIFWKVEPEKNVTILVPYDDKFKQMFRHPTIKIILEKP